MPLHLTSALVDTGVAGVWGWPVAVASLSLVLGAIALSRWLGLGVEMSLIWASARAAVQLLAVGILLGLILEASFPDLWAWAWVAAMVAIASVVMVRRVPAAKQVAAQARDRTGTLEALLAMGFERGGVVRFLAPESARMALIPQIERTKVVGLIALPGAMTGLLLAGVEPIDAVVIQLLVMYLVLGAAAITVIVMVLAVTRSTITPRLQVADWVRPGN
ncbi:MAG: ABC transporter permease [Acidimicrobiia bacterium]|nr:ABC transporter permease [Acidimicrobiia bacterium]